MYVKKRNTKSKNKMAHDGLIFPPSSNWYNFKISALNAENDIFAYGAKNTICVFEILSSPSSSSRNEDENIEFKMIKRLYGHVNKSRISSVEFAKDATMKSILVSGCTFGEIRIWNICVDNKKMMIEDIPIYTISPHNNQPITAITMSYLAPDLLISADEKGVLAINFLKTHLKQVESKTDNDETILENNDVLHNNESTKSWEPLKNCGPITSTICSPYVKNHVIVGYRNGALAVFDWESLTIVSRLHGHKQEIQGLAFLNPAIRDRINSKRQDYLNSYNENIQKHRMQKQITEEMTTNNNNNVSITPVTTEEGKVIYTPNQLRELQKNVNKNEISKELQKLYKSTIVNAREHMNVKYGDVPKLLLTSSRDRAINLWDTSSWNIIDTLTLPLPGGNNNNNSKKKRNNNRYNGGRPITSSQSDRLWLTAAFAPIEFNSNIDEVGILSSSYMGEILFWPWKWNGHNTNDSNVRTNTSPKHLNNSNNNNKCGHNRPVFDILVNNFIDVKTRKLPFSFITNSMDRKIIAWRKKLPIREMPGFGGYVYDMNFSKLTPNLCAVAVGDRTIRVWDTSDENDFRRSTTHWSGLQSEVTCVCWHPTNDGFVAYGTADGSVGIFDVLKDKNTPFRSEINNSIRHIEFRSKNTLYACSEGGDLLEFHIQNDTIFKNNKKKKVFNNNNVKVVNISNILASRDNYIDSDSISSFSWNSNVDVNESLSTVSKDKYEILAIGYKDGTVKMIKMKTTMNFSASTLEMDMLSQLHYQNQKINDIQWFNYLVDMNNQLHYLFATASNDRTVRVFSVGFPNQTEALELPSSSIVSDVATFVGHQKPVAKLAWHPNKQDVLLASASKDGTANVWDVLKQEPIGNCRGSHGVPLRSIVWSTINQCMLYTGSDDQSIVVWDIYNNGDDTIPPEKDSVYHKKFLKRLKNNKVVSAQTGASSKLNHADTAGVKNKSSPKRGNTNSKKKSKSTILPLLKGENDDLLRLIKSLDQQTVTDNKSYNNIWHAVERNEIILNKQIESHRTRGAYEAGRSLEIWRGDINIVIKRMIKEQRLTANFVALSMSGGKALWESAVEAYAKQLEDKGDVHNAVLYYLSISKTREAINVYLTVRLYRDALTLAMARLSPMDPQIRLICKELGKGLEKQGYLLLAREAFLIAKEDERANASEKKLEFRKEQLLEKLDVKKSTEIDQVVVDKEQVDDNQKHLVSKLENVGEDSKQTVTASKMKQEARNFIFSRESKGKSINNYHDNDMDKPTRANGSSSKYFSEFKSIMKFGTGSRK